METGCALHGCPSRNEMAQSNGKIEESLIQELFTNV